MSWEVFTRKPHHRAKLTTAEVRSIRMLHTKGWSQHRLARRFKVSQATISQVVHRDTWKTKS